MQSETQVVMFAWTLQIAEGVLHCIFLGSHLREKTAFFTQKKSRLRKSENAVRLLYAKNSDLTHQNAFSLFVFSTQQRRFVEHLLWV